MKKAPFSSLLLLLCIAACNRGTSIKKSVQVHGDQMTVSFSYIKQGKKIHDYEKTFHIAGMTKAEQESIVEHIADSLDIDVKPVTR